LRWHVIDFKLEKACTEIIYQDRNHVWRGKWHGNGGEKMRDFKYDLLENTTLVTEKSVDENILNGLGKCHTNLY
jgi:hypothetical protein